jgi:hypothetical protein
MRCALGRDDGGGRVVDGRGDRAARVVLMGKEEEMVLAQSNTLHHCCNFLPLSQ